METDYLKEFIAFSRSLNYAQTAEDLYLSQPTLRSHIKSLEDELGAPLTCKRGGQIDLSPVGKVFLRKAREIIEFNEKAFQECREYFEGTTSITVSNLSHPLFDELINAAREEYRVRYPEKNIDIRLSSGMFSNVESLQNNLADMALFSHVRRDQSAEEPEVLELPLGIESLFLKTQDLNFWMEASNPLFEKEAIRLADLSGYTLLLGNSSNMIQTGEILREEFKKQGVDIFLDNCPFGSYHEYLLSSTPDSFGIVYQDSVAHHKGLRVFTLEGFPIITDLFILLNKEVLGPDGLEYFRILQKVVAQSTDL